MDRATAITDIEALFAQYRTAQPTDQALLQALTDGKLYELYVLADTVERLSARGFSLSFPFTTLNFKASPGMIKASDPHFVVQAPDPAAPQMGLYVDIEFDTLGHHQTGATDNSRRHEIDIVLTVATSGYPAHDEIVLGIECKAVANFGKGLIKEALGIRRELSLLSPPQSSALTTMGGAPAVDVPANPPSEYWLSFIDPKGLNYADSPAVFGIVLRHLDP